MTTDPWEAAEKVVQLFYQLRGRVVPEDCPIRKAGYDAVVKTANSLTKRGAPEANDTRGRSFHDAPWLPRDVRFLHGTNSPTPATPSPDESGSEQRFRS